MTKIIKNEAGFALKKVDQHIAHFKDDYLCHHSVSAITDTEYIPIIFLFTLHICRIADTHKYSFKQFNIPDGSVHSHIIKI